MKRRREEMVLFARLSVRRFLWALPPPDWRLELLVHIMKPYKPIVSIELFRLKVS